MLSATLGENRNHLVVLARNSQQYIRIKSLSEAFKQIIHHTFSKFHMVALSSDIFSHSGPGSLLSPKIICSWVKKLVNCLMFINTIEKVFSEK